MITVIFFRKSIIQNFEFDWLFHSPIYFVLCSSSLFLDSPFNPKRIVVTCEREEEITMKTPTTKVVNLKTKKSLSKRPRLQDVIDIDTPIRAIACLKKIDDMRRFEETEDCFILGFDPYAAVGLSVDSSADDVSVIAEKGKVACRDYPHSRHLCLKFPFKTTPHESYCEKVAPCKDWKGWHCNAESGIYWKNQRNVKKIQPARLYYSQP
ncbi:uncharacterized protein [Glycine max]|uniref:Uncharacterized protein n=2 Tax=Glycine soja TaxID=3848 RepID=A0A445K9D0_GLYSO|nr:uncharacterized protein LOC100778172 isoform X2 [Glycine max]RZC07389.1 hypothetical protein D0Y65_014626 [Glycine soja]